MASDRSQRPEVIVHVAVSLDGATTGFPVDVGRFYELAGTWREDVTLVGADTILAQEQELAVADRPGPSADAPLLAVVDGRRRVRGWDALRECGYWSGVLALRTDASGRPDEGGPVREIVAGGGEHVDLPLALGILARDVGAKVVRVDSGGELIGALLRDGLVDEISLLVHPCTAANAEDHRWYGSAPVAPLTFALAAVESLEGGLVWLRYRASSS